MSNPISIPLINVSEQNAALREEIQTAVMSVIDSGAFVLGPEVTKFEADFQAYTQVKHAISCASGTDALLLPLMAENIGHGDEVLVPSFTFYATAGSVSRLGATPIFVDSDATYNMCPTDLARKITSKTKAIIPVHLFGQMADMKKILEIANAGNRKIPVVEDAAQSMGAAIDGKQCGLWGDYSAYSFYPTKNLGAMGDAGMNATLTEEHAERLKMLRVHGSKVRYYHELVGVNSRLDSIQAAILRVKLKHLKTFEQNRGRIAEQYTKLFTQTDLMKRELVHLPIHVAGRHHVWNQYTVRVKNRDALRKFLADRKIGSEIYYPLAMHEQKAFASTGAKRGDLPFVEKLEAEVLSLPMFPELPLAHLEIVVQAIVEFYKN